MVRTVTEDGFVARSEEGTSRAVLVGPRTARTSSAGELLCSYMSQSRLSENSMKLCFARSTDAGTTWTDEPSPWPAFQEAHSIFCSLSRAPSGDLMLFGSVTKIDTPGESFWSEATQGLKANDLFWSRSTDDGHTWSDPHIFPLPLPGAAECPGPMQVTRDGVWLCCYAPYNTFDPAVSVERNHVVAMRSVDEGATWSHASMMQFDGLDSGGAEAWIMPLSNGRVLGTTWHVNYAEGEAGLPNTYAISSDGGVTWSPTRSTGTMGQSTALAALDDGKAIFLYNQRGDSESGIGMAIVQPTDDNFGILDNGLVWRAGQATTDGTGAHASNWSSYAFGEPSITVLDDGAALLAFWSLQPGESGIRYLKLRMA